MFIKTALSLILFVFLISCSFNSTKKRQHYLPEYIITMNNDAKWILYVSNFEIYDYVCDCLSDSSERVIKLESFVNDLNYTYADFRYPIVTVTFTYSNSDYINCYPLSENNKFGYCSIVFDIKTKKVLSRLPFHLAFNETFPYNADTHFFQEETDTSNKSFEGIYIEGFFEQEKKFIHYLKNTTDTLPDWLYQEAIRRGVFIPKN